MRSQLIQKSKDFCHVDSELLPFKIHFFFCYAAYAGVWPFMPVIAKELGINATAVGIMYSMVPIFILLSNPIIGLLVDYFQNIKIFLMVFLVISCTAFASVLGLPPLPESENIAHLQIVHHNDSAPLMNVSTPFEKSCLEQILNNKLYCEFTVKEEIVTTINNTKVSTSHQNFINVTYNSYGTEAVYKDQTNTLWTLYFQNIPAYNKNKTLYRDDDKTFSIVSFQCSPDVNQCSISTDFTTVFSTYQIWVFFVLIVIAGITSSATMNLSSVSCYEILGTKVEHYGRQRLFGTISWGIVCPLSGIFNDMMSSTKKTFLAGYYLMGVFVVITLINLCLIRIPKPHISNSISSNLGKIFRSKEILVFGIGVAFVGFFSSMIVLYEFWFLEDMGAKRTLLGLSATMQCLVGEVPFLFFAGWFVKKLGHFLCIAVVFVGFTVRFLLYSILQDPWLALPIDTLHGITFGLYHGAMVSFAKAKAPIGMEATLLGVFSGLSDGLGHAIGSFVSGFGVDGMGPRSTFFTAGMISLGCILLFLAASYFFRTTKTEQASPEELDETARNEF